MNFINSDASNKKQSDVKSLPRITFIPPKKLYENKKTAVEKSQEKSFIQSSPRDYSQE